MPMYLTGGPNGLPDLPVKIHATRADITRRQVYIRDGAPRTGEIEVDGIATSYWGGVRQGENSGRITFEYNTIWCYVDHAGLVRTLDQVKGPIRFTTRGKFDWTDFPPEDIKEYFKHNPAN